jgi:hypothetical protein
LLAIQTMPLNLMVFFSSMYPFSSGLRTASLVRTVEHWNQLHKNSAPLAPIVV